MAKKVLGKGLGALISGGFAATLPPRPAERPDAPPETTRSTLPVAPGSNASQGESVIQIDLENIKASPFQPRKQFDASALGELRDSIRERGVLQPLLVRRVGDSFELIAGERRFRAARELGLKSVPALVREATDPDALELALIENLQRENLNPLEEARGYRQLIEQFSLRQEDIAQRVGKNRATIANALRLLSLPDDVQSMVEKSQLTVGHAKVILSLDTSALQKRAAQRTQEKGLTVRALETLIEAWKSAKTSQTRVTTDMPRSAQLSTLEEDLQRKFGTRCRIVGENKGKIEIEFYSAAELNRLLVLLGLSEP